MISIGSLPPLSNRVMLTSGLVSRSDEFHFMIWRWSLFRWSVEARSVAGRPLIFVKVTNVSNTALVDYGFHNISF